MKIFFLMLLLIFVSQPLFAVGEKTGGEDDVSEFKETKFLQIDPFDIPKDLSVIEGQIAQNAIDVIILTGKYTVNYSEKRPEGYNKNFRNFYGLKISIFPLKESSSEYALKLFFYNWTTNKYDRTLSKRISKYNVLNEMRFAMFDLILGPEFVRENRDILERKNFERIQAVRQLVEAQEKRDKQKKKMEKEAAGKKEKQAQIAEEKKQEEEKLKREKKKKTDKSKDSRESDMQKANGAKVTSSRLKGNAESSLENEEDKAEASDKEQDNAKGAMKMAGEKKNEVKKVNPAVITPSLTAPGPEGQNQPTPKTVLFNLNAGLKLESVDSSGLLVTKTNLNYLSLGADYRTDIHAKYPWGYGFSLNAGIPIKKEQYQISVSRALEGGVFKTFFSRLSLGGGLEYSSLIFANLAEAGAGLKVVQNDLLYGKLKFSYQFNLMEKEMIAGFEKGTSLFQKSDINKAITVTKTQLFYKTQILEGHGAELRISRSTFTGFFSGKSSGVALLYVYNFGN